MVLICVLPQVALWGKGILCKKSAENTNYTTHVWLHRLSSAEIALAHISCGFEVYLFLIQRMNF